MLKNMAKRAALIGVLGLLFSCSPLPPAGWRGAEPGEKSASAGYAGSEDGRRVGDRSLPPVPPATLSQDLLYVSDLRTVSVYSYPKGALLQTLRHFYLATGMCVDAKRNVFIVDLGYGKVFEYAHGETKRTATIESVTSDPVGCSVDTTTGNLAITSLGSGSAPTVAIYYKGHGKPVLYKSSAFAQFYFCGFDANGNLFADGLTGCVAEISA